MSSRAGRLVVAALIAALPTGTLSGCRSGGDGAVMETAWELVLDRNFDGALPLLRDRLERHPEDPAAHYLFGKCHLHRQRANTTIALGEFETALHYFGLPGGPEFLGGGMDSAAFLSAVHRDAGLSLMRALYEAVERGLPPELAGTVVERALSHVNRGLESAPADDYLLEMRETLRQYLPAAPRPEFQREITL